ncbi:hypothetical protein [Nitrosophilus labii]|uniref:hypothetical protein n=1 Tax=Nitrosophilus labii TaxID=2706014 RepID=UPI001656F065|nr:hypothetical protein [Nitrosophilus labii]
MKKFYFVFFISFLFFSGCSSKQYFEPKEIAGKVEFDKELPAKMIDVTRDGATLENGQVITEEGLLDVKLPQGFEFIGDGEEYIVGANNCGDIVIIDKKSKKTVFKKHFDLKRASAAKIKGDILALVFDTNEIMVVDFKKDEELYSQKSDKIYSVDTKIASPYFLGELILFPTLDGKIIIVDKVGKRAIRNILVGTEKFLNNIIFLNVLNNRLIAATPNKVVSVNPKNINTINIDLSDILFVKDAVYILAKDGRVIMTDPDLNILKTRKYPFAHFTGIVYGEYIYIIEKEGYIIATDHSLRVSNVFELSDKIEDYIFTSKDKIFYKDKFFQLNKK